MPRDSAPSAAAAPRAVRLPPYSEEAERGVLGSILIDSGRVMDLCVERQLTPESFYVSALRTVYEAMQDVQRVSRVVDVLTVSERLRDTGRLDGIGGSIFLERLIDFTPTAAHAEYYIDIVRQKHLLRSVIDVALRAEASCYDPDVDATTLLGQTEQNFFDITAGQHGTAVPWPDMVKATITQIEKIVSSKDGGSAGVPTGFRDIDKVLMGMRDGNMLILAARPSMGKTSLALNIAENVATGSERAPAQPVAIFSLEMSRDEIVMRMLCSRAQVSSSLISGGYISPQNHQRLVQAADALVRMPIYLDDTPALDITEIRARARRLKKKHEIKLIVVDYLQLLHCKEYIRQGRQVEISAVSGGLKAMAKELRIPVLVLSQLSRAPETRDKLGKPKLSDLRESGSIEQDADLVFLLRRPCKYEDDPDHDDKTLAVVDIAKHRNGPTNDDVRLYFEESLTQFRDRAHGVDEPAAPAGAGA